MFNGWVERERGVRDRMFNGNRPPLATNEVNSHAWFQIFRFELCDGSDDGSAGFRGHVQFHVGLLLEGAHDTEKVFRTWVAAWSQHSVQALARFFERCS